MKIESLQNCTGCHACFSACPKRAIAMCANGEGFLYPQIDHANCVECGLCEKVCPAILPLKKESEDTKAYAAINRNEAVRMESSSGGIFTAIAEKVIEAGGVVFGARFAPDFSVVHGWTETADDLADFRGSKYLQSVIGSAYKDCKYFLDAGRKVLFSGTPCQVQGLKKYLGREYGNLLAVDFICHGVPSPLLWQKYVDFRAEKCGATRREIVRMSFRRKNCGWKTFALSFAFANDSAYAKWFNADPYGNLFIKDIPFRMSCYDCPAKSLTRVSDITLADFWGVENELPEMDDNKGTSIVLVHSPRGNEAVSVLGGCVFKEIPLDTVRRLNPSVEKSCSLPKARSSFYKDLHGLPFERVIKKYTVTPLWLRPLKFARRCAGKAKRLLLRKIQKGSKKK